MFADDTVILASNPGELPKKIKVLKKYFDELKLNVNVEKTKFIVLRKGGPIGHIPLIKLNGKRIKIMSEYTYLDVQLLGMFNLLRGFSTSDKKF